MGRSKCRSGTRNTVTRRSHHADDRFHDRFFRASLTVKLRGRPRAPNWNRGCTLSPRTRGDTTDSHGPLQRLLGVMQRPPKVNHALGFLKPQGAVSRVRRWIIKQRVGRKFPATLGHSPSRNRVDQRTRYTLPPR